MNKTKKIGIGIGTIVIVILIAITATTGPSSTSKVNNENTQTTQDTETTSRIAGIKYFGASRDGSMIRFSLILVDENQNYTSGEGRIDISLRNYTSDDFVANNIDREHGIEVYNYSYNIENDNFMEVLNENTGDRQLQYTWYIDGSKLGVSMDKVFSGVTAYLTFTTSEGEIFTAGSAVL